MLFNILYLPSINFILTFTITGRKFAMLQLKVLLSTVLRNYKIYSDVPQKDWKLQADIILKRADGFRIRLEPRKMTPKPKNWMVFKAQMIFGSVDQILADINKEHIESFILFVVIFIMFLGIMFFPLSSLILNILFTHLYNAPRLHVSSFSSPPHQRWGRFQKALARWM